MGNVSEAFICQVNLFFLQFIIRNQLLHWMCCQLPLPLSYEPLIFPQLLPHVMDTVGNIDIETYSLSFHFKFLSHILASIMGTGPEVMLQQLEDFFSCIDRLAADMLSLPTSLLSLIHLQTPCMSLASNGRVSWVWELRVLCHHETDPI